MQGESYSAADIRINHFNITISHTHVDPLDSIIIVIICGVWGSIFPFPKAPTIISFVPIGIVESGRALIVFWWNDVISRDVSGKQAHFMQYKLVDSTAICFAFSRFEPGGCTLFFTLWGNFPTGKYSDK